MINPDGYSYTHTIDRFWSKNRGPTNDSECTGVNLNRNFPSHWQYPLNKESRPCDRAYKG